MEKLAYDLDNLKALYDQYNLYLFEGRLPEVLFYFPDNARPVAETFIMASISAKGKLSAMAKGIGLSRRYCFEGEALKGVLLHEMIHVKVASIATSFEQLEDYHGVLYLYELERVQSKVSFNIPLKVTNELLACITSSLISTN